MQVSSETQQQATQHTQTRWASNVNRSQTQMAGLAHAKENRSKGSGTCAALQVDAAIT